MQGALLFSHLILVTNLISIITNSIFKFSKYSLKYKSSKCSFTYLSASQTPCVIDGEDIIFSMLQMETKTQRLAQGHSNSKWQNSDVNQDLPI